MGAMDGINEAGLAVALLADNETPEPEPTGTPQVGLSEQQVVRYLLDSCATVEEAKAALLLAKHYYFFTPCHFLVADRSWRLLRLGALTPPQPGGDRRRPPSRDGGRLVVHQPPAAPLAGSEPAAGRQRTRSARRPSPTAAGVRCTMPAPTVRWSTATRFGDRFEAIRFTAPIVEARTFWHALYDVDEASMEVSFFTHDADGRSVYSEPLSLGVGG